MNDEPEVFGMNENANIAFQVCGARYRPMLCKGVQEVFAFSLCTHHLFPPLPKDRANPRGFDMCQLLRLLNLRAFPGS